MPLEEALAKLTGLITNLITMKLNMNGSQRVLAANLASVVGSGLAKTARGATAEPAPRWAAYLSCHSFEAAMARSVKTELVERLQRPVYLDFDDLESLRDVCENVRSRSDVLVLMLTAHALTRPWIVVEVLVALDAAIPVVPVLCDRLESMAERLESMAEFVRCIDDGRFGGHWPEVAANYSGGRPFAEALEMLKTKLPELLCPREATVLVLDFTNSKRVLDAMLDDVAAAVRAA